MLTQYHARLKREAMKRGRREMLDARDPFAALLEYGRSLIRKAAGAVNAVAEALARSAMEQVKAATGKKPATPDEQVAEMRTTVEAVLRERLERSNARARAVLDDFDRMDSETDEDAEARLSKRLDGGLDGIIGGGLASAALLYGDAWAAMNQATQESVGVSQYIWVAQRDKFTRAAHAELDDTVADWSKPPLTADKSSSGRPCHAGQDYNCRCIAAPLPQ